MSVWLMIQMLAYVRHHMDLGRLGKKLHDLGFPSLCCRGQPLGPTSILYNHCLHYVAHNNIITLS